MVNSKKKYKETILLEKSNYRISKKDSFLFMFGIKKEKTIIWNYQKTLRKAEYLFNKNSIFFIFKKLKLSRLSHKYGIYIPINVAEEGLYLPHLGYIRVNGKAKIGKNCKIHVNTFIVADGKSGLAPIIGNNVIISVGSKLIGDIIIADDCVVGAGAVVTKSFDECGITIAGVPAKKISSNGNSTWVKHKGENV